ncbi:hypothetical protein EYF80_024956 [Liparis tanakae]|uniref:Uncharacterized protein n=1 Tax=Liparis tanakae TaxID=230148 RepID=A0A4Z2HHW9_9TELE|nr:hypothetical protein EYF80_024956 [Liparis tanakae]
MSSSELEVILGNTFVTCGEERGPFRISNKVHMSNFTLNCLVHGLKQPPELSSEQLPHIVLPASQ